MVNWLIDALAWLVVDVDFVDLLILIQESMNIETST